MFYMIETIFNKIPKEFMKEKGVKFNGSRIKQNEFSVRRKKSPKKLV